MSENFPFMDTYTKERLEKWLKKQKEEYFSEASKYKEGGFSDLSKCHRYAALTFDTILWHMKHAMENQGNPCNQEEVYKVFGYLVFDEEHRDILTSLAPETWIPMSVLLEIENPLDFPEVYKSYNEALSISKYFDSLKTTLVRVITCEKSGKVLLDIL